MPDDRQPDAEAAHPYRPGDATRALDPEIVRCLHWSRDRLRRTRVTHALTHGAVLAACVAVSRVHWAGWVLFAVLAVPMVTMALVSRWVARDGARFEQRLGEDPGQLVGIHVDAERDGPALRACELQLRDGTRLEVYVPAAMARDLADRAPGWPVVLTRTPGARATQAADLRLRRIADRLRGATSSLATHLAAELPAELPSCAGLPGDKLTALQEAIKELEILLDAAVEYDASRARTQRGVSPEVIALLDSTRAGPVYADRAVPLVRRIRALLGAS